MLEVADIDSYYGESHVLFGVSLHVPRGSIVAILGRNGMGKTTIMRSIMGLTPPRSGSIRFKEREIAGLGPNQIARIGLAYVPQGRGIFPSLSVKENLTMAARQGERQDAWTLENVYAHFPILRERANLYGNLLSGGEQQMLSIARALMTNPDMLVMDEPSEGLAPLIVKEISSIIGQVRGAYTVLLAEQNMNMALGLADYVYVISKGVVVHQCKPEELRSNMEIKSKYLGV